MKNFVLSAITVIVLTVCIYHIAALVGAPQPILVTAITVCIAAAVIILIIHFFEVCGGFHPSLVYVSAAVLIALLVAIIIAATNFNNNIVALIVIALLSVVVAVVVAVDEDNNIRYRWLFLAFIIEALAIWGALKVADTGWSIVIAGVGCFLLLVHWRIASKQIKRMPNGTWGEDWSRI